MMNARQTKSNKDEEEEEEVEEVEEVEEEEETVEEESFAKDTAAFFSAAVILRKSSHLMRGKRAMARMRYWGRAVRGLACKERCRRAGREERKASSCRSEMRLCDRSMVLNAGSCCGAVGSNRGSMREIK